MRRHRTHKGRSARKFNKRAARTKAVNVGHGVMRGGIRF